VDAVAVVSVVASGAAVSTAVASVGVLLGSDVAVFPHADRVNARMKIIASSNVPYLLFILYPPYNIILIIRPFYLYYPFTAPIVKPFIKYFWKKGYANMIGPVAMSAIAILEVSEGRVAKELFALLLLVF
jgi:hypothetical protein